MNVGASSVPAARAFHLAVDGEGIATLTFDLPARRSMSSRGRSSPSSARSSGSSQIAPTCAAWSWSRPGRGSSSPGPTSTKSRGSQTRRKRRRLAHGANGCVASWEDTSLPHRRRDPWRVPRGRHRARARLDARRVSDEPGHSNRPARRCGSGSCPDGAAVSGCRGGRSVERARSDPRRQDDGRAVARSGSASPMPSCPTARSRSAARAFAVAAPRAGNPNRRQPRRAEPSAGWTRCS